MRILKPLYIIGCYVWTCKVADPQCFCCTTLRDVIFANWYFVSVMSTNCTLQHAVVYWVTKNALSIVTIRLECLILNDSLAFYSWFLEDNSLIWYLVCLKGEKKSQVGMHIHYIWCLTGPVGKPQEEGMMSTIVSFPLVWYQGLIDQ
jgi:hypothetical protein